MNQEKQKQEINKNYRLEIIKVTFMEFPASVLVGLGLYAKVEKSPTKWPSFLNNNDIVDLMLLAGGALFLWGNLKIIKLAKQRMTKMKEVV